jgi:hypothetical protein
VVEREIDGAYRLAVWNDVAHLYDAIAEAVKG